MMEEAKVSITVTVCVPAVFKIALKLPTPPVSVAFADKMAAPSVLVK